VSPLESWVRDRCKRSIDFLWTCQIICSQVALLLNRAVYLPVTLEKCCINTGIVTFQTHTLCVSSRIMGEGQMEKIYWLLMNFTDNLLTSCTSIEQGNLTSSSIEKYCMNTGIVTFETHLLCVSSWIMGDRLVEKIYWLLMNFPDNLLTSCTTIEQGNLRSSSIVNIYYINTGIVTFQTHTSCVSSWIMGDRLMNQIYHFFMNFPDNLLTSCTTIEQGNLPSSSIGKMLYQHRDSDIPNTHIMWPLLNHGWGTDEYYLSIFYERAR
jgi:hypothetical protein